MNYYNYTEQTEHYNEQFLLSKQKPVTTFPVNLRLFFMACVEIKTDLIFYVEMKRLC